MLLPESALGRTDEELFGAEIAAPLTAVKRRVLESGRGERGEVSLPHGGESRCWDLRLEPCREASGRVIGIRGAAVDVTEHKRAAAALTEARETAVAANHAKTWFLANISHELRTPTAAVLGMLELSLRDKLPPDAREHLQLAKSAAEAQLEFLNQILDFSRLEAGKIALEVAEFNLRAMLDQTLKVLGVKAHEKGLEISCDMPCQVPVHLLGDPLRLRQILVNLIGNAIKFTDEGEVLVRVEVESQTPQEVSLRFSVTDTGVGIPPENLAKLFAPFSQAEASTTRRYGGTGLGLSIAATLVSLLGGRLSVESEPGGGSTFAFDARFGRQSEEVEQPPLEEVFLPLLRDLPVLVVAGHPTCRRLVGQTLRDWALQPALAASVGEALATAQQRESAGQPFELLIVDVGVLAGDEQALDQYLRRRRPPRLATVLMVPRGARDAGKQFRRLHKDALLLAKPVSQTDLFLAILRSRKLQPSARRRPSRTRLAAPASRPLRILVADDEPVGRLFVSEALEERGHAVRTAASGREALELVRDEVFDVVLMDVQMPDLNGYQAAAAIRALPDPVRARLPLVAISARAPSQDEPECRAAGMDACLTKPITTTALLELVERLAR